jgi:DNA primase
MARIADEVLERLKAEVSLERLVEAAGVKLDKKGRDRVGRCPFHEDDTPSLVVSPDKNLWHCLGACQMGGSVVDWVMKGRGVSFRHAVELIKEEHPALAADPTEARRGGRQKGLVPAHSTKRPLSEGAAFVREAADETLLSQVVDFYHQSLKESPEALSYLKLRGLDSSEAIDHFKLGYAGRTLGYRLPPRNRKEGAELRERLTRLGVYRESGHEHLAGSVVVPVFSPDGRVLELYGRKVGERLRKGTPKHLYLPGPHRGVFNLSALEAIHEIILCESLFDALAFWCAGLRTVTASYGTSGFTDDHREAFEAHGIERVYIAYDRDKAGDRAADKLAEELSARGIECFRVLFPRGMDACEYALKVTPAQKSLRLAVSQSVWMAAGKKVIAVGERNEAPALEEDAIAPDEPPAAPVETEEPVEPPTAPAPPVSEQAAEKENPPPSLPPSAADKAAPCHAIAREAAVEPASAEGPHVDEATGEVHFAFGPRRWRVRGLDKNDRPQSLRVNLFVRREQGGEPGGFHVDTIELYAARQRAAFIQVAADELGLEPKIVKGDLGRVLLALEALQAEARAEAPKPRAVELSDEERQEALAFLRNPHLVERLLEDFERAGVVGERSNKLLGYLAAVSRKLDAPLAVVIQSSSAAGKSSLMEAILSFIPDEERVQYSAMTGQSLFYMGEQDLSHRILAIVEEEGAERASYALKLLQSEGELTIASTGKDPHTGRLVTQEYRVEGPVMIMLTTTAIDVDEELLNRCIVLSVDESRAQTKAIHARQRRAETLAGLFEKRDRRALVKLHQNAQRLLRPLSVVNPHAERLRFFDHKTRTRRDHTKYLTLIRAIALLHQHQRPIKTAEHRGERLEYIEATEADIALAESLCREVLARGIDELPPQTRRMLFEAQRLVETRSKAEGIEQADFRFSRRELREASGWSQTQVGVHLRRLEELEYVLVHPGPGRRRLYELCVYDPVSTGPEPSLTGGDRGIDGLPIRQRKRNGHAALSVIDGADGGCAPGEAPKKVVVPIVAPVH